MTFVNIKKQFVYIVNKLCQNDVIVINYKECAIETVDTIFGVNGNMSKLLLRTFYDVCLCQLQLLFCQA